MPTSPRSNITLVVATTAFVLLSFSALAHAQAPDVTCKPTETQPECHARLKCKPYEELEDCQKRLKQAGAKPQGGNQNNGANDQGRDDNRDNNRGDRGDGNNDRGDRSDRNDGNNDRGDRGNRGDRVDRGDNDDGGRRQRGERSRGQRQRGSGGGSKGFQANKTFGLGLELGEPTGLTGKYFFSDSTALDFGLGWIYRHYYYGDGLNVYGDILFHPTSLVSAEAFELPFYIGGGLRFWSFDYCDRGPDICYRGSTLGVRVPIGIAFDFNNVPLDIFLQLVPVIDFVSGDYYDRYRDRTHIGVDFSVGLRFWFK